ncbi:MAG: hypothetical protein JWM68_4114, partial [Verrucomicrobiales bacterium]|nr:hypothetical protein [Verrucomicrobiales bacterium]
MALNPRAVITKSVETNVLTASQRKCCLCYYLDQNRSHRRGQLAHLSRDRSDSNFDNLVWLCLEHHDVFDSRTSQSKGYTSEELRIYRDRLYRELGSNIFQNGELTPTREQPAFIEEISHELRGVIEQAQGQLDWLLSPWKLVPWHEVNHFLFPYKASNRCDGICGVERHILSDGRVVVICKKLPQGHGQSVTNSIEELAFQVCDQFKIAPRKLVLIDYYPGRMRHGSDYTLVSFQLRPPEGMF